MKLSAAEGNRAKRLPQIIKQASKQTNPSKTNQTQNCFIMFLCLEKVIRINPSILHVQKGICFLFVSITLLRGYVRGGKERDKSFTLACVSH